MGTLRFPLHAELWCRIIDLSFLEDYFIAASFEQTHSYKHV